MNAKAPRSQVEIRQGRKSQLLLHFLADFPWRLGALAFTHSFVQPDETKCNQMQPFAPLTFPTNGGRGNRTHNASEGDRDGR